MPKKTLHLAEGEDLNLTKAVVAAVGGVAAGTIREEGYRRSAKCARVRKEDRRLAPNVDRCQGQDRGRALDQGRRMVGTCLVSSDFRRVQPLLQEL